MVTQNIKFKPDKRGTIPYLMVNHGLKKFQRVENDVEKGSPAEFVYQKIKTTLFIEHVSKIEKKLVRLKKLALKLSKST